MVSLDDLRELVLYKKPFFLPIEPKNKKYNSAIMLLTPSYQASIMAMTKPYMINHQYFESYYIEKNLTKLIQNESVVDIPGTEEQRLLEAKLKYKERKDLSNSEFGLPRQRKYPLNDKNHVLLAIKFFNHCPNEDRDELAHNILRAIGRHFSEDEYSSIHVGKDNAFLPYWEKSKYYKAAQKNLSEARLYGKKLINNVIGLQSIPKDIIQNYYDNYVPNSLNKLDIRNRSISYLNRSMNDDYQLVGDPHDVAAVSRYLERNSISICYEIMNRRDCKPKLTTLNVVNNPDLHESFGEDSVLIYTPSALRILNPTINYSVYIKYILQLFAVYTLKPKYRYHCHPEGVLDSLAEPAAVVLSGIVNERDLNNKANDLKLERLFIFIIDTHGMDFFIEALASNDLATFTKCVFEYQATEHAKKYTIEPEYIDRIRLSLAEAQVAAPSLPKVHLPNIEEPDSIKKIKNMRRNFKIKMRQPIYKLTKVLKDLQAKTPTATSNTSSETSSSSEENTEQSESIKTEQLKKYTDGDYITEGQYVYLFEDSKKYDPIIKKALFRDRLKNNKQVIQIYNKMKQDVPFIRYSFVDLKLYKNRNIFVDLSYYNESI